MFIDVDSMFCRFFSTEIIGVTFQHIYAMALQHHPIIVDFYEVPFLLFAKTSRASFGQCAHTVLNDDILYVHV